MALANSRCFLLGVFLALSLTACGARSTRCPSSSTDQVREPLKPGWEEVITNKDKLWDDYRPNDVIYYFPENETVILRRKQVVSPSEHAK